MFLLNSFIYYICFGSAVLFYGIGLTKTTQIHFFYQKDIVYIIKNLLTIISSSLLSYLIVDKLIVPLGIIDIYPLICLLVYLCISVFFEAIVRITTNKSTTEFIFSYLVVLLSVTESTSLLTTFIISFSCIISICIVIPLVYSFRKRNPDNEYEPEKYISRLFIYISLLLLIISVWDVVWLNPEVMK